MPSKPDRRDYTVLSRYHLLAATIGFCIPLLLGVFFDFGNVVYLISALLAAAFFCWIPPVKRKNHEEAKRLREILDSIPEPVDTNIDDWELPQAAEFIRSSLIPKVWDKRMAQRSEVLLEDALWIRDHFDALVDFPEHQATVKNTVRQWVPKTLRLFIHSETATSSDRNRAVDGALRSLATLHNEVLRIKAAIVQGQLMDLESEAAVLNRESNDTQNRGEGR